MKEFTVVCIYMVATRGERPDTPRLFYDWATAPNAATAVAIVSARCPATPQDVLVFAGHFSDIDHGAGEGSPTDEEFRAFMDKVDPTLKVRTDEAETALETFLSTAIEMRGWFGSDIHESLITDVRRRFDKALDALNREGA